MFDIVATDQHKLPLPIQAEGIDQPEPRLPGPSTRNTQPMSEGQPVNNRKHDEGGDAASRKQSDLENPIVRERKLIQPLHAQSNTSAAERLNKPLFNSPAKRWFSRRPRSKIGCGPVTRSGAPSAPTESVSTRAHVTFHNKMRSR
jgi:hypothetical protein